MSTVKFPGINELVLDDSVINFYLKKPGLNVRDHLGYNVRVDKSISDLCRKDDNRLYVKGARNGRIGVPANYWVDIYLKDNSTARGEAVTRILYDDETSQFDHLNNKSIDSHVKDSGFIEDSSTKLGVMTLLAVPTFLLGQYLGMGLDTAAYVAAGASIAFNGMQGIPHSAIIALATFGINETIDVQTGQEMFNNIWDFAGPLLKYGGSLAGGTLVRKAYEAASPDR